MPPIPAYDLAFRFERALQPDALRVVTTCARAVNEAMDDARLAGLDPETDPAVLLLARHMGRIAAGGDPEARHLEDAVLRASCTERIQRLRSADVLVPLVRRGVGYDPHLIRVYKDAARTRLRALAHELGFYGDTYDLRSLAAGSAVVPRFELATDRFRLQLDPDRMMPGREVTYMRAEQRQGGWTGSPTHAWRSASSAISPNSPAPFAASCISRRPPKRPPSEERIPSWDGSPCRCRGCTRTRHRRRISTTNSPSNTFMVQQVNVLIR